MCGRFSFSTSKKKIQEQFGAIEVEAPIQISFNIAPTQLSYVLTNQSPNELQLMNWGLVPHWSKDKKNAGRLINARMETIAMKPSFRTSFERKRCLAVADSFYEWKRGAGNKFPYRILRTNRELLVMAGIWDTWTDGSEQYHSFSIITTPPNAEMARVHDRMPVIFYHTSQYKEWLEETNIEKLQQMLISPPDGILEMYTVSTDVNFVRNNGVHLHNKVIPPPTLFD
ncbi:MAG: SOS response-associated peptidase [Saprospiraceae bacterium]|jgi:putative SOS response-associated peptidase YedK|nr:SOS response-associated peptidase [Saprospiraceae bacterium]